MYCIHLFATVVLYNMLVHVHDSDGARMTLVNSSPPLLSPPSPLPPLSPSDIRKLYYQAGVENKPTVFLFNDTQVVEESFLEDINNILSSGEVPNLYKPEDFEEVQCTCTCIYMYI